MAARPGRRTQRRRPARPRPRVVPPEPLPAAGLHAAGRGAAGPALRDLAGHPRAAAQRRTRRRRGAGPRLDRLRPPCRLPHPRRHRSAQDRSQHVGCRTGGRLVRGQPLHLRQAALRLRTGPAGAPRRRAHGREHDAPAHDGGRLVACERRPRPLRRPAERRGVRRTAGGPRLGHAGLRRRSLASGRGRRRSRGAPRARLARAARTRPARTAARTSGHTRHRDAGRLRRERVRQGTDRRAGPGRYPRPVAARRGAAARRRPVHRQPAHGARDRRVRAARHAGGRGVGAALHDARLPLLRDQRAAPGGRGRKGCGGPRDGNGQPGAAAPSRRRDGATDLRHRRRAVGRHARDRQLRLLARGADHAAPQHPSLAGGQLPLRADGLPAARRAHGLDRRHPGLRADRRVPLRHPGLPARLAAGTARRPAPGRGRPAHRARHVPARGAGGGAGRPRRARRAGATRR